MTNLANLKALASKQEELATSSTTMPLDQRMRHVHLWSAYEEAEKQEREYKPFFQEAEWESHKHEILPPPPLWPLVRDVLRFGWYFARWVIWSIAFVAVVLVVGYGVWRLLCGR